MIAPTGGVRAGQPWPSLEDPGVKVGGGEKDVALVITIESYADLPPIDGAEANGVAWVRWFEKARGVRPDKIVHLINKQGTPGEMLAKARELVELADPKGRIWVVFIGHGAPAEDQTEGLFVGWAAQQNARELYGQSLRQSELVNALGGGRKAPIVVVADACFNGTSRSGEAIAKGLQPVLLTDRQKAIAPNVTVLSAGRADQFA
ncbi:MAG: caspase family protein, partial [Deltaproteobacteria bacterium]|nr:caspase family protein [Deltaproteobacteria bacterium]